MHADTSYILHDNVAACVSDSLAQILRITLEESTSDVSRVGGRQRTAPRPQRLLSAAPLPAQPCLSAASRASEPGQVDGCDPGAGPAPRLTGSSGVLGADLREESAADVQQRAETLMPKCG